MTRSRTLLTFCIFFGLPYANGQTYLSVSGTDLRLNNEKVFMSGMNLAWYHFGMDFGNGRYQSDTKTALVGYLDEIANSGGNSMRLWLHCAGATTPAFDSNGYVTYTDAQGTMIADLSDFLDRAQERNILLFIVLWNGARPPTDPMNGLIFDDDKLNSYIDNALTPMVTALSGKRALGGWEIMNEPEGMMQADRAHLSECFDTRRMRGSGMGWVNTNTPTEDMMRFIARQTAAIHRADSKALVTVGSWSEKSQNDAYPDSKDFYTDLCMFEASNGDLDAYIDFYQMHTYTWQGNYNQNSPFKVHGNTYNLGKPNVIGEFSQAASEAKNITHNMNYAYYYGYNGAWTWHAVATGEHTDDLATQKRGLEWLRNRNDQTKGGRVNIDIRNY